MLRYPPPIAANQPYEGEKVLDLSTTDTGDGGMELTRGGFGRSCVDLRADGETKGTVLFAFLIPVGPTVTLRANDVMCQTLCAVCGD